MRPDAIARRYARALFSLSNTQQSLDAVSTALATTTDVLTEPSVMRMLTGPVSRERKRALLLKIIETTNAPAVLRDFLLLLADHGRLSRVGAIKPCSLPCWTASAVSRAAAIRSASPLSADLLEEITRTFGTITGRKVLATIEVVPDLIAGVIVEVDGKVYDGSLRSELSKLRHHMATGS